MAKAKRATTVSFPGLFAWSGEGECAVQPSQGALLQVRKTGCPVGPRRIVPTEQTGRTGEVNLGSRMRYVDAIAVKRR
jgi:hypothetical protein